MSKKYNLENEHLTINFDDLSYAERKEVKQFDNIKSLTVTFKHLHHIDVLKEVANEIVGIIEKGVSEVNLNMDFRTFNMGGWLYTQSYYEILKIKDAIKGDYSSTGALHDGTVLLEPICEALKNSSTILKLDFGKSAFYPNCEAPLRSLAASPIEKINFNKSVFFNFPSSFFVDNFSNSGVAVDYKNVTLRDRGENLGLVKSKYPEQDKEDGKFLELSQIEDEKKPDNSASDSDDDLPDIHGLSLHHSSDLILPKSSQAIGEGSMDNADM